MSQTIYVNWKPPLDTMNEKISEDLMNQITQAVVDIEGHAPDLIKKNVMSYYDFGAEELTLAKLSVKFPSLYFEVYYEDYDDGVSGVGYDHYINGKVQYCPAKVTYPKFNIKKMRKYIFPEEED